MAMLSRVGRFAALFATLCVTASCLAQGPKGSIALQPNWAKAQKFAKSSHLPVMGIVVGKGDRLPKALNARQVVAHSRCFVNVVLPAEGAFSKKLDNASAGSVIFLDAEGKVLGQVEPEFTAEQLLAKMNTVLGEARARVLETLNKETKASSVPALEAYVRLGASVAELIPLLTHKNREVKTTVGKVLATRKSAGADWVLLNAMASPDGEFRVACHQVAVTLTRVKKVQSVKFWKEATEADRAEALQTWREAVFGKVPPLNKAILDFAYAHFGKQVNDGECAMLVVDALKAARAQNVKHEGKTYVWGKALKSSETALPGDVVQLEEARFSNGMFASHHTQIVSRVLGPGVYEVLEQNANGRRTVGTGQLNVKLLTRGTLVIYRPIPLADETR
jgi:hypothetical protein